MPKVSKDDFKPYFDIKLRDSYDESTREEIAQEIIDEIISRTERGKDADNKSFVGYSSSYSKEKGQSNVDLTFSGDMLAQIRMLETGNPSVIRIGFSDDYDGIGKVEGNILGTYGRDKPVNKGRNFLGIKDSDLRSILNKYKVDEDTIVSKEVTRAANRLARNSNVENPDDEAE